MTTGVATLTGTMRVCKTCGIEKPLSMFDASASPTGEKHHRSICRRCLYIELSNRNKQIYGFATTPIKRERVRRYGTVERIRNMELYGATDTPEQQERSRERHAEKRIRNIELYGCASAPERLLNMQAYHATKRAANLELYGITTTPEQQKLLRDKRIKVSTVNRKQYGTALTPEQLLQGKQRRDKEKQINLLLYSTTTNPKYREAATKRNAELRYKAIQLYEGKCECCGEADTEVLTFDHINGARRAQASRRGAGLVRASLEVYTNYGYPNGKYRLLCWNCNSSVGHYGYCPHSKTPAPSNCNVARSTTRSRRTRAEMIDAYGGKCVLCGETNHEFLTIDHVNGGGVQHRKNLGNRGRGTAFYFILKRQGWPQSEYRLLCYKCNCGVTKRKPRVVKQEDAQCY